MVVCNVCQGERFELQDGHYYCVDCHTQALDWREEEGDEGFTQGTRISYLATSFRASEEQEAEKSQSAIADLWTSWEGLNNILLGQVSEIEALVPMPQDFRFIVFNLWAKYLQVTEIAFTKKRTVPHAKQALCNRDKAWIYQEKFRIKRKKKPWRKKAEDSSLGEDSSEVSSRRSISILKRKLMSQKYLSESSANESASSMTSGTSDLDSSEVEEDGNMTKWKTFCDRQLKRFRPRRLTRKTLLGIIFLALRMCKSQIQLSDLVRWLKSNHVSYRWVEHFLPGESALNAGDAPLFGPKSWLLGRGNNAKDLIMIEAKDVHALLDYPAVPHIEVMDLVQRYLKELVLPECLSQYIQNIVHASPPKLKFYMGFSEEEYVSLPEERAMAYVVFILKLMLGLDDLAEHQSEDDETKTANHFIWDDWVEFTELRKSILVDNFFWAKQMFNPNALQTKNNSMKPDPNALTTSADMYISNASSLNLAAKSCLASLTARLMNKAPGEKPEPRPDPTKSLEVMTEGIQIALAEGSFQHMAATVKAKAEHFRQSSCQHLLDSKILPGESTPRATVNCVPKNDSIPNKNRTLRVKIVEKVTDEVTAEPVTSAPETSGGVYWSVPFHIKTTETWGMDIIKNHLPLSMVWLLELCAALVDSSPVSIYRELLIIEAALLKDKECPYTSKETKKMLRELRSYY